jgi:uncharacterized membrane protein YcaP (DUF421 family)
MELDLWSPPLHILGSVVRGLLVYVAALVAVRVAGRRSLAQLSAFDAVVTIAIGSIAATTAVPAAASVVDGTAVLLAFLGAQVTVSGVRRRWPRLSKLTDFAPEAVVLDGEIRLPASPTSTQMTVEELHGKLRQAGIGDVDHVAAAILESSGQLSVTTERRPLFDQVVSSERP